MTLLVENLNHKQAGLIVESTDEITPSGLRPLYMQGIFIQGGVTNHNRRVYPVDEIRSAVDQVNDLLESGESLLGECDHPQGLDLSLDRVSHKISWNELSVAISTWGRYNFGDNESKAISGLSLKQEAPFKGIFEEYLEYEIACFKASDAMIGVKDWSNYPLS